MYHASMLSFNIIYSLPFIKRQRNDSKYFNHFVVLPDWLLQPGRDKAAPGFVVILNYSFEVYMG